MREIKFRGWCKKEEKMITPLFIMGSNEAVMVVKGEGCWLDPKNIMLMQYTGLKDKNGEEIYEGDVITFELNTKYGLIVKTGLINCNNLADCFVDFLRPLRDGDGLKLFDLLIEALEIEIIGNIYENSELIERNK